LRNSATRSDLDAGHNGAAQDMIALEAKLARDTRAISPQVRARHAE
jgi:hypothetical protein